MPQTSYGDFLPLVTSYGEFLPLVDQFDLDGGIGYNCLNMQDTKVYGYRWSYEAFKKSLPFDLNDIQ